MSLETLNDNLTKDVSTNKINVNILKNRVFEKKRKVKFQNRIILGSVLVSIGLIGYFVS